MGKKLKKFPFLFRSAESSAAAAAWPWPAACVTGSRTLSFRADPNAAIYKTINSAYDVEEAPSDSRSGSFSVAPESGKEAAVIGGLAGLRSDRLFFEPGETNSILEVAKCGQDFPYKAGSVAVLALESRDPFLDFRLSMEEMVAAQGLKDDWDRLEELLTCYLRVNGKSNHGYIVGAFIDLLMNLALASAIDEHCSASSSSTTQDSFVSHVSFSSYTDDSSNGCNRLDDDDDDEDDEIKVAEVSSSSCSSGV